MRVVLAFLRDSYSGSTEDSDSFSVGSTPPPANFMWYGGKGRRMAAAVSGRISVDLSG